MTETFRGLIAWLFILPIGWLLMLILWLPTFGHSVEWFEEPKFATYRWIRGGFRGIKIYSVWD